MVVICVLLWVYWAILLVRVLSSWFPIPSGGTAATLMGVVHDVTEPVLRPLRNLLPPIRLGAMALDLSPIILFIAISILQNFICG